MKFLKKHPGVSITLLIGYLTCLGYLHLFFLLRHFNIDGSHFVQASDLLLVLLRSAPILLLLLLMYALNFLKDLIFNLRHVPGDSIAERMRKLLKVSLRMEFILLLLILPILSGFGGHLKARLIESKGDCVVLQSRIAGELGIPQKAKIIESTSQYVFLLFGDERAIVVDKKAVLPLKTCVDAPQNPV